MNKLRLTDEAMHNRKALDDDFQRAMLNPERRGRKRQTVDYSNIPVATDITIRVVSDE